MMKRAALVVMSLGLAVTMAQAGGVEYTFNETAPGQWDVLAQVIGTDNAGLSAFSVWVYGDETASFTKNVLSTFTTAGAVGFNTIEKGHFYDTDSSYIGYNAGGTQSSSAAIEGIGMVPIYEPGLAPGVTPLVELGVPALLGTLTTAEGLGAANFAGGETGLLNLAGDGYLEQVPVTTTVNPVPEPATMSLLALSGIALLRKRR